MPPIIDVQHLRKVYTVSEREAGLGAALRSLVRRQHRQVVAVDDVSFQVSPGEIIGFLGPNGAGKTTTLKMMAGLLYPTAGHLRILGHEPHRRSAAYLRQMTLVMGQRNQLTWDIPAVDSFDLVRAIYDIPPAIYRQTLDELVALLDIGNLIRKPVRNLSLGERMKCEIAGALLHRPTVLFLDEPTIGLDITAQRAIRAFIAEYNQRHNATIMLTSHYMADVEALAQRIIVIHHGTLLFDGALGDLVQRFSPHKTIKIQLEDAEASLEGVAHVVERSGGQVTLRIPKEETPRVTSHLLAQVAVRDMTIEDPTIEEVIEQVFNQPRDKAQEAVS
jgi:ABC-2 type transport system ATP-binding protein